MVKRLPEREVHDAAEGQRYAQKATRPRGRPRNPATKRSHARVAIPTLAAWAAALAACLDQPRAKSTAQTLEDMRADMLQRAEQASGQGALAPTVGYRVVTPDGSEHRVDTVAEAAALYGCKPTSLATMLAKRRGRVQKKAWLAGAQSVASVERLSHP